MEAGESFRDLNAGTTLPTMPMAKHTAAQTMETVSINVRTSLAPGNADSYPILLPIILYLHGAFRGELRSRRTRRCGCGRGPVDSPVTVWDGGNWSEAGPNCLSSRVFEYDP